MYIILCDSIYNISFYSADQVVEWQDKYWEASDEFGHKELGSEKSGRDATGSVWREYWKESMWLVSNNFLSQFQFSYFLLYHIKLIKEKHRIIHKTRPKLKILIF
jgi:hypothetical protein